MILYGDFFPKATQTDWRLVDYWYKHIIFCLNVTTYLHVKNYFTLGYACLTWYAIYYFGYILTAHFYWNRKTTNKLSSHYYVLNLIHISPLCDQVCQWLATGRWFTWGTPVSSTNKTDHRDKTEILLKVVLNTIILTNCTSLHGLESRFYGDTEALIMYRW